MSVYFIRSGNFIKIGHATNPNRRLKELQTGNPNHLELMGVIPGGPNAESHIHSIFSDFRTNGEWFELTTDILAFMQTHKSKEVTGRVGGKPKTAAHSKTRKVEKRGAWVEFRRSVNKDGTYYYPRWRGWKRDESKGWTKVYLSTVGCRPLTASEFHHYKQTKRLPDGIDFGDPPTVTD
jgi:hypothetical protein